MKKIWLSIFTIIYIALLTSLAFAAEDEITLPRGLTEITEETFSNCESITTVKIPNGVNVIGPYAFRNCTALSAVYIPESVNQIARNAFDGCHSCTLYVFKNSDAERWAINNQKNYILINNEQHRNGDYYYCLSSSTTATIVKYTGDSTGNLVIPDLIDGYTIIGIGEKAFAGCSASSIQLPSHLLSIGYEAFYYSSIYSITLPLSLESIASEAFMCCHALTQIHIPAAVQSIGSNPFRGCISLMSITADPNNAVYGIYSNALIHKESMMLIVYPYGLIGETLTIPDGIKIIGDIAFGYEGPTIKNLVIPNSVETIGSSAFAFSNVQHIEIGSGVTNMEYGPFTYCGSLKDVIIADGATYIGNGAFSHCSKLETVIIPDSVTYIGDSAFAFDYNVYIIANPGSYAAEYAKSVGLVGRKKYGDFLYEIQDNAITIIRYTGNAVGELVLPATIDGVSVTAIGEKSFESCSAASIVLPNTLQIIGYEAFYYCSASSINIPTSVTTIASEAFMCCHYITEIHIPASVTTMGSNPFRGCSRLQTITVDASNQKYGIYSNALIEKDDMRLIVYPYGLIHGTFAIPDGIQIIGTTSFGYEGPAITKLIIPDSVITIEGSAFPFSSVNEIIIGAGIQEMGSGVFTYCESLRTVTIAEGTTVIGNGMFSHCGNLETITIPNSVTQIADNAFDYDYNVNIYGSSTSEAIQFAKRKGYAYTIE